MLNRLSYADLTANQVGAPLVRRAVSSRTAAPVRNLAAYAKPQKMTFQKVVDSI